MAKQRVPEANKPALANGSEGLQLGQVLWPVFDVHPPQTDANGTGRHDDDAVTIFAKTHGGLDDQRERRNERLMACCVDDGARS